MGKKIGEKVWVKKDGWKKYRWKLCKCIGENFVQVWVKTLYKYGVTSMGDKKV